MSSNSWKWALCLPSFLNICCYWMEKNKLLKKKKSQTIFSTMEIICIQQIEKVTPDRRFAPRCLICHHGCHVQYYRIAEYAIVLSLWLFNYFRAYPTDLSQCLWGQWLLDRQVSIKTYHRSLWFYILLKPWWTEENNVHLLEVNAADIMIIIVIHSHHINITLLIALNGSTEINMKSLINIILLPYCIVMQCKNKSVIDNTNMYIYCLFSYSSK